MSARYTIDTSIITKGGSTKEHREISVKERGNIQQAETPNLFKPHRGQTYTFDKFVNNVQTYRGRTYTFD